MNRMEEYESMLAGLASVPDSDPVGKAKKRWAKVTRLRRSLAGLAAAFCVFVGIVNVSPSVSAACREIPFLKELVELLTFNPSLRIAIEHDYVQMVGQEQTKDDVKVRVEYLIVDQKQVNVFFTLTSEVYEYLDFSPELRDADGERIGSSISYGGTPEEEDDIRQITIDFIDEDVPDYLELTLRVRSMESIYVEEEAPTAQVGEDWPDHEEPEAFTELTFELHFDPQYTGQGRTVELDKTVELDGQIITITDMEIYPTHIRINVQEDASNTSWLQSLKFYLELENGFKIETISNGISATGSQDTPSMVSYRAESSFFYEADCIRLYITSADFLDKEREQLYINFETLESDPMPQGVRLWSAEEKYSGTELTLLVAESEINHVQVLGSTYYDMEGNAYHCGSWSSSVEFIDEATMEKMEGWGDETYYLEGFHAPEAVFEVNYTHFWVPEKPIVVDLVGQ